MVKLRDRGISGIPNCCMRDGFLTGRNGAWGDLMGWMEAGGWRSGGEGWRRWLVVWVRVGAQRWVT